MDNNWFTKLNISQKKFLTNFIKKKHPTKKAELHLQYKNTETYYQPFWKKVKKNIMRKTFESNRNNAKIIWKCIKSIITLRNITSSVPRTILQGENLIILMILLTSSITSFLLLLILLRKALSILINIFYWQWGNS